MLKLNTKLTYNRYSASARLLTAIKKTFRAECQTLNQGVNE